MIAMRCAESGNDRSGTGAKSPVCMGVLQKFPEGAKFFFKNVRLQVFCKRLRPEKLPAPAIKLAPEVRAA